MLPVGHAMVSGGLGAGVWMATGSAAAGVTTLCAGVLIDGDHLVEAAEWLATRRQRHFFAVLHAWEWAFGLLVAAALLSWHPILTGLATGMLGHLVTDQISNDVYFRTYSVTFRIYYRFRAVKLLPCGDEYVESGAAAGLTKAFPLMGRIADRLTSRGASQ